MSRLAPLSKVRSRCLASRLFTTGHGIVGTPQSFAFDLSENKIAAAVSSDPALDAQVNRMALSLANFMASSQLGSSGSQDLVSTPPTQQDQHLPMLAPAHS